LFIVAEVPGYASGQLEFTISVSQHQLIFVPAKDAVTQSARNAVDVQNLRGNLWLDGRPINDQDFAGATTDAPSWLQFDSSTIGFSGNPPTTSTQTISIWARDTYGDVASMVLEISFAPGELYNGSIGVLNATAGAYFLYQLSPTDFPERNVSISVGFGAASGWLKFDRQNLSMAGLIPLAAPSEIINAGLTVTSADGKNEYFQSFEIRISMSTLTYNRSANSSSQCTKDYYSSIHRQNRPIRQIGWSNSWFGGGCGVHGTADNMQSPLLQFLRKEAAKRGEKTIHVQAVYLKASRFPWRHNRLQCRQRTRPRKPIQCGLARGRRSPPG
jgi:hypothetical protein